MKYYITKCYPGLKYTEFFDSLDEVLIYLRQEFEKITKDTETKFEIGCCFEEDVELKRKEY